VSAADERARLRALCERAVGGPWEVDVFVPGLRAEIEEARDGRDGEWWEVSR
jgi:hypothetical protein